MPPSRATVILALLVAGAAPAATQAPAERAAIESWRDSLAGIRDSAGLKVLETGLMNAARRDRDNPIVHLRLGFLAYRLGELGAKSHFEDAAGEFEWAAELRPGWPYPWYGLGLSELALGEHAAIAVENIRQALGKDYLSKAAMAFARATEADPAFSAAVVDLVTTALSQRIRPRLEVAQSAARQAAAGPAGQHASVQLARGRVERELGEADSAVVAFRAALAADGDSGVVLLELARSLFFARRPADGRVAYAAGLRTAASLEAVAGYRGDLAWVATAEELAEFDGLSNGAPRAEWVAAFWARRDFTEARAPGERLGEHYRRWAFARRNYRLVSRHRHYDITEVYRSTQTELDDRGIIYMRHGDPDQRASFVCPPAVEVCAPNESWIYRQSGGDLVFHFAARDDVQDFKLVESLVDVLGFRAAVVATGVSSAVVSELYASRVQFGPNYERVARGATRTGTPFVEERRAGKRSIAVGTTSDSYARRFEESLRTVASDFVAGVSDSAAGERQALHVVFAIPAARLTPEAAAGAVQYPLRFRLQVVDARGRAVAGVDTFRVFAAAAALERGQYLTGRMTAPVPAGRLRYRLLIETPDGTAGDVVAADSLDASPLDGRTPAVSDLVLGRRGAGLAWMPPGDTVLLNPLGTWPEGGTVELYYEVHGLSPGTSYRTAVTLEKEGGGSLFGKLGRLFGGRRQPVLLEFDAVAEDAMTRVHRAVELGDLARGNYIITVSVTDPASGATHVRRRPLQVVGRA